MIIFVPKIKKMLRGWTIILIAIFLSSCNGCSSSPDHDSSLPMPINVPAPEPIIFKVTNVYPHDPMSFTQGLEYHDGKLYEGTGEFKRSKLMVVNIKTGVAEKTHTIPDPTIFGEGITILNNKIFQLTWQNNKIFEYNINDITRPIKTYPWPHEGWGVTNNGHELIISDGITPNLYFVTPDENSGQMIINKTLTVRDNIGPVQNLNELELINGSVYANQWLTNNILVIDTTTGHVTGILNFTGIMKQYDPEAVLQDGSVLNGIAYDSASGRLFITGKDWPKLFEIELVR